MATKKHELIAKGQKIRDFRLSLGFSMVNLSRLTGISPATISRIENGGDYMPKKLASICNLFGVEVSDLLKIDLTKISKDHIYRRISDKVKREGITRVEFSLIKKKTKTFHGPSYLIKRSIEDGFLGQFREVAEVQDHIEREYGVRLFSSSITNALMRKDGIVFKPTGKANYNKYKFVKSRVKK